MRMLDISGPSASFNVYMTSEMRNSIQYNLNVFTREMEVNSLKFPFFIIVDNPPQFLQDTVIFMKYLLLVLAEELN